MNGMIDMHCHILPGVDDGARDAEQAIELLQEEYRQGVRKVILTPHRHRGMFEPSVRQKQEAFRELAQKAERAGLDMELYLGCEFHTEAEMAEKLRAEETYRMAGSRYVLTELPIRVTEREAQRDLAELIRFGYKPIVAHVERYEKICSAETVYGLIRAGARIQVNAGSLLGAEGWRKKRIARKLLEEDCVHFVGSDAHDMKKRIPRLQECAAYLERSVGKTKTRRLLIDNPDKILADQYIETI